MSMQPAPRGKEVTESAQLSKTIAGQVADFETGSFADRDIQWRQALEGIVRDTIASRLKQRIPEAAGKGVGETPSDHEFDLFMHFLLGDAIDEMSEFVRARRGRSAAHLCSSFLTPAARRIGEMWVADKLRFMEVTTKIAALQKLMRGMFTFENSGAARAAPNPAKSVLLLAAEGEQHTFGLSMLAEHFWAAGWDVRLEPRLPLEEAALLVGSNPFMMVGMTVGHRSQFKKLPDQISLIRRASLNAGMRIALGGPAFHSGRDYPADLGADAVGVEADEAVWMAESFIETKKFDSEARSDNLA